jgi:hypothetical protein
VCGRLRTAGQIPDLAADDFDGSRAGEKVTALARCRRLTKKDNFQ